MVGDGRGVTEYVIYNSVIGRADNLTDTIGNNGTINANETAINANEATINSTTNIPMTISPPLPFSTVAWDGRKFEATNSGWIMFGFIIGFVILGLGVLLIIKLCYKSPKSDAKDDGTRSGSSEVTIEKQKKERGRKMSRKHSAGNVVGAKKEDAGNVEGVKEGNLKGASGSGNLRQKTGKVVNESPGT